MAASPSPDVWAGRRVLVAGAGISGRAMVTALRSVGAEVQVADDADNDNTATVESQGVRVLRGLVVPPDGTDLVATSPGFRPSTPLMVSAAQRGIPVVGEPELAWRLRGPAAAPWLALTGTDGKTTTVAMLAAILAAAGLRTVAAGNIGLPLVSLVTGEETYDVLAVELSSAQLYWSQTIHPTVGTLINIAPDHLDWTGGFEAYIDTKVKIWDADVGVANLDDEVTRARFADARPGRKVGFRLGDPAPGELGVVDGVLVDRAFGPDGAPGDGSEQLAETSVLPPGEFNIANALAAAAMARGYGVEPRAIATGLAAFRPEPHRNEVVAELDGVTYVNNSKATSPHAAGAALSVYPSVVWVAGGLNKGLGFDELVQGAASKLRAVVLLGSCQDEIAEALARHAPDKPVVRVSRTDDGAMVEAVRAAARLAQPGDSVLLAPAAASMDMFRNYNHRGEAFSDAVRSLVGSGGEQGAGRA